MMQAEKTCHDGTSLSTHSGYQEDGQTFTNHNRKRLSLYNSKTRTKQVLQPSSHWVDLPIATQELFWQASSPDSSLSTTTTSPPKFIFTMYTCGPTVYDAAHIGNFRAFLTYDLVKRVLQYFGWDVLHVCNLTDIDDKILQRAQQQQLSTIAELTNKYTEIFMQDLAALNIRPAQVYPRATDHGEAMMDMVVTLNEVGLAYETADGSWYFRTQALRSYGTQLVQLNYEEMVQSHQEGVDAIAADNDTTSTTTGPAVGKEHFADFCLWKAFKNDGLDREDAAWSSPERGIVKGRPGWHLECSAMAKSYFGPNITMDLHGGGIDLQFPHHENEIAQAEGASKNGQPYCHCWFHNGFVNLDNEKMSKSLGNFLTLATACPTPTDVRAYRYLVLCSQYRNPLSFSPQVIQASKRAIGRIDKMKTALEEAVLAAGTVNMNDPLTAASSVLATQIVPSAITNFEAAIADDLSMPRAAAALFTLVKAAEHEFKRCGMMQPEQTNHDGTSNREKLDLIGLNAILQALNQMDQVFGIFYQVPQRQQDHGTVREGGDNNNDAEIPDQVLELVSQRAAAKEAQDWELADSLRARVIALGFAIQDIKGGEPIVSRRCDESSLGRTVEQQ